MIVRESVGRWVWREETIRSLTELRSLSTEELQTTVLRLHLEMAISVAEQDELDRLIAMFAGTEASHGRAGAFVLDRRRLRIEVGAVDVTLGGAPETVRTVGDELVAESHKSEQAKRALLMLYRLVH